MLTIKVTGLDTARTSLGSLAAQLSYAASRALNAVGAKIVQTETGVMRSVFDRPTAFTLNSLRVDPATKTRLVAVVKPKDAAADGRSADRWLGPEALGGARRLKAFERSMQAAGILPAGMSVVPGPAARLDVWGNWSRSDMNRILVAMRQGGTAVAARRIDRLKAKGRTKASGRYFALQQQDGELEPGIYERKGTRWGTGVRPVVLFTTGLPRYRRRFPFEAVAERVAAKEMQPTFERELAAALATAR